jgi:endonuclease-8
MPEGPSIVILKEHVMRFKRKKIIEAGGDAKVDYQIIQGKTVEDIKSCDSELNFNNCSVKYISENVEEV